MKEEKKPQIGSHKEAEGWGYDEQREQGSYTVSEAQDYGRNQSDEEAGTETSTDANKCLHWFVYIPSHNVHMGREK